MFQTTAMEDALMWLYNLAERKQWLIPVSTEATHDMLFTIPARHKNYLFTSSSFVEEMENIGDFQDIDEYRVLLNDIVYMF